MRRGVYEAILRTRTYELFIIRTHPFVKFALPSIIFRVFLNRFSLFYQNIIPFLER